MPRFSALLQRRMLTLAVVAGFVFLGAALWWMRVQPEATPNTSQHVRVAATIFPIYDVARTLGVGEIDVQLIVPPGASPHTFTFTPQGVAALQGSQVIFAVGQGLDGWIAQAQQSIPGSRIVYTDRNVVLRTMEEHDEEHEDEDAHGHGMYDPHYYLSVVQMQQVVRTIVATYKELKPESSAIFESRANAYVATLAQLHDEFTKSLAPCKDTNIVTMHDAWGYFADAYQLVVAGTFEPSAGEEPTPQYLAALRRAVKIGNVRVLFGEPQLSTAALETFAKDLNVSVAQLDPEGGLPGRETYLAQMRYNAQAVERACNAYAR